MAATENGGVSRGILLYYKYVDIKNSAEAIKEWYKSTLGAEVVGRVRVAYDGVNATLGGPMWKLEGHITEMKDHPLIQGEDIDFKLAVSGGALSATQG